MGQHVNQGLLRAPAPGPTTPFCIFKNLPIYLSGTIPIGVGFLDVALPHAVDTAKVLVILNAGSCLVSIPQTQIGTAAIEGEVNILTGALVGILSGLALTSGFDSQSVGAWYSWTDPSTIRIHRAALTAGECVDCNLNCVGFSVQIFEFNPLVICTP